jgi:uncharacterized protein YicC (UPF0701 family)
MPVYSMTGFASASAAPVTESDTVAPGVTVEVRTVNSRFLDIAFRLPDELRQAEPALRELLTGALRRGKVECAPRWAAPPTTPCPSPRRSAQPPVPAGDLGPGWLPKAQPLSVHEALQWCRGSSAGAVPAALDELVQQAAKAAIDSLKQARAREGKRLVAMLLDRIGTLRTLAAQAEPLVPAVVQQQQQRFLERWQEALASAGDSGHGVSAEAARTARWARRRPSPSASTWPRNSPA